MARVNARTSVFWVATLLLGLLVGSTLVGGASAAPAGPPGGLEVAEQNLDQDGNIKVHEQGVVPVDVQNESFDVNLDFPDNQQVTITNTTPLSVQGTVGAQQVDDWKVAITNTPDVNVVGMSGGGIKLAPATRASTHLFEIAHGEQDGVDIRPVLNASTILISSRDEVLVRISGAIGGTITFGSEYDDDFGREVISLIQPWPVTRIDVWCNEGVGLDCFASVTLIGD